MPLSAAARLPSVPGRPMHPSRVIRGRSSQLLDGRRIVVGVSGSIAAVEVVRIIRELIRHGAEVRAVLSADGAKIVTAEALAFATGHPTITTLTGDVEHVAWMGPGPERADLYLIAPATANTISKVANGIDDTPVTSFASVALGGGVPVLVAPAMHEQMARNPAIQENLERLGRFGVVVIRSTSAEGEEKLASPEEVAAAVLHRLGRSPWTGRSVVVIGGAGRERIDEVRSVTNESSGELAIQLAAQAYYRGAEVELWSGALAARVPEFLPRREWTNLASLESLVAHRRSELARADLVLVPAALPDFSMPARPGKIDSRAGKSLTLSLRPTSKLLPRLRSIVRRPHLLVGFKLVAESDPAEFARAAERLTREHDLDAAVGNGRASMGSSDAHMVLRTRDGTRHELSGRKVEVAGKLLDALAPTLSLSSPPPAASPSGRRARRSTTRSRRA